MPIPIYSSAASANNSSLVQLGYVQVGTPVNSIFFSSIPQNYQDLVLIAYGRNVNDIIEGADITFNRISQNAYSTTYVTGDGSSASSSRVTNFGAITFLDITRSTSNIYAMAELHINSYSLNSKWKTILGKSASDQNGSGNTKFFSSSLRFDSPITSLTITKGGNGFAYGSNFALYAVRAIGQ